MSFSRIRFLFVAFFFITFLTNAVVVSWMMFLSSQSPHIELTVETPKTMPLLCPGEQFSYSFTLSVDRPASVDLSYSILSDSSVGSTTRQEQFIFNAKTTVVLHRQGTVPNVLTDLGRGDIPWQAGEYRQSIQARITGSARASEALYIPFRIREDCKDE